MIKDTKSYNIKRKKKKKEKYKKLQYKKIKRKKRKKDKDTMIEIQKRYNDRGTKRYKTIQNNTKRKAKRKEAAAGCLQTCSGNI